tara:strand:- start:23 stop:370 length:348 start_codon:yes stop_codon:yes gene_type:complete
MGYRSKVILGVKQGELSNEFDEILKQYDFNPNKCNDYLKISDTDGYKTYLFDYIKWYSSDDWCKAIMDWLETQENVFCVGMGEEGELHSEIGDWWEYVNLIRDINLIDEYHDKRK